MGIIDATRSLCPNSNNYNRFLCFTVPSSISSFLATAEQNVLYNHLQIRVARITDRGPETTVDMHARDVVGALGEELPYGLGGFAGLDYVEKQIL